MEQNYNLIFEFEKSYKKIFEGSDQFYLADPKNTTPKNNGGVRWGVKKEFYQELSEAISGHLSGSQTKGVVLPPIRKSDNKCKWGAIDIDGEIYSDVKYKFLLLLKVFKYQLPLVPCYSKSKGLHLYIFFKEWTDAKRVIEILRSYLKKLHLPKDTEIFPKQHKLSEKDTGNGIMLPFMSRIGNDYIKDRAPKPTEEKPFIMGTLGEFCEAVERLRVNADEIEIDLPEEPKPNGKLEELPNSTYSKWDILRKIKDGSIEQHPTIGGKYYSWIQIIICKCIKQGYGDNEILKLIKEVHKEDINSEYVWPESYKKQIDYTRGERQLNIPNPGDTNKIEGNNFDSALKLDQISKSYCYVMANDLFNRIGTTEFYQEKQINNYHKHEVFIKSGTLTNKLLSKPSFARAETFVTSAKHKPGLLNIDKPGIIPLINKGKVLNIYIPNYLEPIKGDILFLTEFYTWLIGERKWKIIEEWIAYMVQYPGVKIKWAIVLVSEVEGVGKGLLAHICSRILGEDNVNENANYKHLTNSHNTLLVGKQLIVLNEVSLGDFKSKKEGTNTLKNFVGDPVYSCNFKNKPMVVLPNLTNFMLFSNDPQVLGVSQGVRRYFFCNIQKTEQEIIEKTDQNFFQEAFDFVDSDEGASALLHYFKYEIKIKDPSIFQKRAPQTEDLLELIEKSKHPVIKKLEYDLTRPGMARIFDGKWCGLISFNELNDKMNTKSKNDFDTFDWGSYGDDALFKFLSSNCTKWNNGEDTRQIDVYGKRQRFYLLDDARCPIPNKSYKDLTPKQIETIYKYYTNIKQEIEQEGPNLQSAKDNIEGYIKTFKMHIGWWIDSANSGTHHYKHYKKLKGKTVDEVYLDILNEKFEIKDKDRLDDLKKIKEAKELIYNGARTPEEIFETYMNGTFKPRRMNY
jgi:hypothetical protein